MAYDKVEPHGHPLLAQWHEWGRQIASLLISASAQTSFDPEDVPKIGVPEVASEEPVEEPLDPLLDEWEPGKATAEDILRDYREQQLFL